MTVRRSTVILVGALVAAIAALAAAGLAPDPAPATLSERVDEIAGGLRCPVCQNLSVADSDSAIARGMRRQIARDLRAGATPEEIRRSFVASYGEWILQEPEATGLSLIAWIAPPVTAALALAVGVVALRRWTRRRPAGEEAA